ncbi:hypothetical protein [Wenxinia marina]|uniref:Uncharacterized protein n=1 Tax=Wenxinia marina DSM 24838 TaxID=1123501 RepID=A0A0D0NNQ0_9RHOB|nr:hypothetical protein [Wenxinia marina]KIQ69905.1 hypothetical protein Wenmar_01475 [Wenxinia marina DSM 24838]
MRALPLLLCLALPSCTGLPAAVAGRIPEAERVGAPPPLVPLGPLLSQADAPGTPDPGPALSGRAAALNARAAALRRPVLSPAEARRLSGGVETGPLS